MRLFPHLTLDRQCGDAQTMWPCCPGYQSGYSSPPTHSPALSLLPHPRFQNDLILLFFDRSGSILSVFRWFLYSLGTGVVHSSTPTAPELLSTPFCDSSRSILSVFSLVSVLFSYCRFPFVHIHGSRMTLYSFLRPKRKYFIRVFSNVLSPLASSVVDSCTSTVLQ